MDGGARVVEGREGWWFIGPGGSARLDPRQLTEGGALRPAAERALRARGLCTAPPVRRYALTVLISTDCNAGCDYCFQNTARGGRRLRIPRARLEVEQIPDILAFATDRMADAGLDRLAVQLFGGEPLVNPRACLELLARAADHGLERASITTNGVLLTPALAGRLRRLGLTDVQVTFDGDRADHDRTRATRAGRPTFDVITGNLARAGPVRRRLRVNVSRRNQQGISALIERLAARLEPAACTVVFAPVADPGFGFPDRLATAAEAAAEAGAAFGRWYREALDAGFGIPRPRPPRPCQVCEHPAGRFGAVVNPDGTLAGCWETAGRPDRVVGDVRGGYLRDAGLAARWGVCSTRHQDAEFRDRVDAALLDLLVTRSGDS